MLTGTANLQPLPMENLNHNEAATRVDKAANLQDWHQAFQLQATGLFDSFKGQHVAVLNGAPVGHHQDLHTLREQIGQTYGVSPDQPGVVYVEEAKGTDVMSDIEASAS